MSDVGFHSGSRAMGFYLLQVPVRSAVGITEVV